MRRPRRIAIRQRKRFFVGCEGDSERGYGALLGRLLEDGAILVHLDTVVLNGGDPLAIVETAVRQLRHRQDRGGPYEARVVLLDSDRRDEMPERAARAVALAQRNALELIWQLPTHEAFLLRHLDGCLHLAPPTAAEAMAQLRRRWPAYEKGMPATGLAEKINVDDVLRVADVHAELRAFLVAVGLIPAEPDEA